MLQVSHLPKKDKENQNNALKQPLDEKEQQHQKNKAYFQEKKDTAAKAFHKFDQEFQALVIETKIDLGSPDYEILALLYKAKKRDRQLKFGSLKDDLSTFIQQHTTFKREGIAVKEVQSTNRFIASATRCAKDMANTKLPQLIEESQHYLRCYEEYCEARRNAKGKPPGSSEQQAYQAKTTQVKGQLTTALSTGFDDIDERFQMACAQTVSALPNRLMVRLWTTPQQRQPIDELRKKVQPYIVPAEKKQHHSPQRIERVPSTSHFFRNSRILPAEAGVPPMPNLDHASASWSCCAGFAKNRSARA